MECYSQQIFALCGYVKTYADIRVIRFCDYFPKHIEKIKQAKIYLLQAIEQVKEMYGETPNEFLKRQLDLLEITRIETEAILQRMMVRWENHCEGKTKERTERLYKVKEIYKELMEYMSSLPQAILGVSGKNLGIGHLIEEQITEIDWVYKKEFQEA